MTTMRLTDLELDFYVDVRLRELDGRWVAVADLAGTPELGVARGPALALFLALYPLGPGVATRLAPTAWPSLAPDGAETR